MFTPRIELVDGDHAVVVAVADALPPTGAAQLTNEQSGDDDAVLMIECKRPSNAADSRWRPSSASLLDGSGLVVGKGFCQRRIRRSRRHRISGAPQAISKTLIDSRPSRIGTDSTDRSVGYARPYAADISPRDKILDAAEALFARRGFAGVGLSEIAEAVGLGKSSLFHHFQTKAAALRRGRRPHPRVDRDAPDCARWPPGGDAGRAPRPLARHARRPARPRIRPTRACCCARCSRTTSSTGDTPEEERARQRHASQRIIGGVAQPAARGHGERRASRRQHPAHAAEPDRPDRSTTSRRATSAPSCSAGRSFAPAEVQRRKDEIKALLHSRTGGRRARRIKGGVTMADRTRFWPSTAGTSATSRSSTSSTRSRSTRCARSSTSTCRSICTGPGTTAARSRSCATSTSAARRASGTPRPTSTGRRPSRATSGSCRARARCSCRRSSPTMGADEATCREAAWDEFAHLISQLLHGEQAAHAALRPAHQRLPDDGRQVLRRLAGHRRGAPRRGAREVPAAQDGHAPPDRPDAEGPARHAARGADLEDEDARHADACSRAWRSASST